MAHALNALRAFVVLGAFPFAACMPLRLARNAVARNRRLPTRGRGGQHGNASAVEAGRVGVLPFGAFRSRGTAPERADSARAHSVPSFLAARGDAAKRAPARLEPGTSRSRLSLSRPLRYKAGWIPCRACVLHAARGRGVPTRGACVPTRDAPVPSASATRSAQGQASVAVRAQSAQSQRGNPQHTHCVHPVSVASRCGPSV